MLRKITEFFVIGFVMFGVSLGAEKLGRSIDMALFSGAEFANSEESLNSEEGVLLQLAYQNDWQNSDPVVFQHIVKNMRLQADSLQFDDHGLFELAKSIGLIERDPVVRARLLYRARQSLKRIHTHQIPDEDALRSHLKMNASAYKRASRYGFSHVFFSEDLRGPHYREEAQKALSQLSEGGFNSEDSHRLGDPLIKSRPFEVMTAIEIENRYGRSFLEAVNKKLIGHWIGPVSSPFGLHLIRLDKVHKESLPELSEISNQIRGELLKEIEQNNYRTRLASLKQGLSPDMDSR